MKELTLPDELVLKNPSWEFEDKNDSKVKEYVSRMKAMQQKAKDGNLYVKFVDGNRKGAIARVVQSKKYAQELPSVRIEERYERGWGRGNEKVTYRVRDDHFYVVATWDKRQNKPEITLPSSEVVFLPNYSGPTVWALFDSKAAKAEVLKNPKQKDIDGKLLKIGDKVLYVNVRYGSGMELNHGKVKEFKASVDSKNTQIWTVVERDKDKEISTIKCSHEMIYKK